MTSHDPRDPLWKLQKAMKLSKSSHVLPSKHQEGSISGQNESYQLVAYVKLCHGPKFDCLISKGYHPRPHLRCPPGVTLTPMGWVSFCHAKAIKFGKHTHTCLSTPFNFLLDTKIGPTTPWAPRPPLCILQPPGVGVPYIIHLLGQS